MMDKKLLFRAVAALEKLADAQADLAYLRLSERGYEVERPPRLRRGSEMGEET